jgi:hypothetical protein
MHARHALDRLPVIRVAIMAAAFVASVLPASAQPSVSASVGSTFEGYQDSQSIAERRRNVSGTVGFEHVFAGEKGRVYYDFDGGTFDSPGDWSYNQHNLGVRYRIGGAGDRDRRLFVNVTFVGRRNGDAWTNADYRAVGASMNAEFHPGSGVTLRSGYRADHRVFADLSALTQTEQQAFGSLLVNLPSRTTLIGEVHAGTKNYEGQVITDYALQDLPVIGGAYGRGRGTGMVASMHPATTMVTPVTESQSGNAGLIYALARVAQSVTDRTGVHVQGSVRTTFGAAPPGLVTTPAGFFDDGVYDDPYASDAAAAQTGLTHAFASGAELSGQVLWTDKRYTSTPALDATGAPLPGSPLRQDTVWRGGITWSQPVFASRTGRAALTIDLGYRFTNSQSNDAFYHYTSHGMGLGFSIAY